MSSHCISECYEVLHVLALSRVISLKTSPGTPSKSASETWNAVTERVYSAAVDGFRSLLTKHQAHTTSRQNKVEEFQTAFLDDVSCWGLHAYCIHTVSTCVVYWPTTLTK